MNARDRFELAAEKRLARQLRADIKRAEKAGSETSAAAYRRLLAQSIARQAQIKSGR